MKLANVRLARVVVFGQVPNAARCKRYYDITGALKLEFDEERGADTNPSLMHAK
jgi:hypothetical protein